MIQICEMMIRSAYIIHQSKYLVTRNYQTVDTYDIYSDLIIGFLSATQDFAETILTRDDPRSGVPE